MFDVMSFNEYIESPHTHYLFVYLLLLQISKLKSTCLWTARAPTKETKIIVAKKRQYEEKVNLDTIFDGNKIIVMPSIAQKHK